MDHRDKNKLRISTGLRLTMDSFTSRSYPKYISHIDIDIKNKHKEPPGPIRRCNFPTLNMALRNVMLDLVP